MRRVLALCTCVLAGFALASIGGAIRRRHNPRTRGGQRAAGSRGSLPSVQRADDLLADRAGVQLTEVAEGETEGGYYYAANNFEAAEHGGTHLDSPIHFSRGGDTADEIPLRRLVGRAVTVDVSARVGDNADYLISRADLRRWERRNGRIPRRTIVLLRTGWERFWPDAERYLGTAERGEAAVPQLHFPGLSQGGARGLVNRRGVKAVGIDTASIDYGQSTDFLAHRVLGARERAGVRERGASRPAAEPRVRGGGAADEDRGRLGRAAADHGGAAPVGARRLTS